jgi:hypothetical protein
MKVLKTLLVVAGMMLLATAASAQFCGCPDDHIPYQRIWMTYDGSLLPGRVSEAWCTTDPPQYFRPGAPGNTEYAQSWDGANLGAQWEVWGMQIDGNGANISGQSMDANGTGWIDYVTNYEGGRFWLSGAYFGPPGSVDFEGSITYYNVGTRIDFLNGNIVGATSNVTFNGWMTETCECCYIEFAIANALRVWSPDSGLPMPSPYPPFICGEEKTPAVTGELFDACCIVASISCPNSTEDTSWGAIKGMFR